MTVHDVAAYILTVKGRMPAVKLHKLLYYSQAWSLVWDDRLLFRARIEAWAQRSSSAGRVQATPRPLLRKVMAVGRPQGA